MLRTVRTVIVDEIHAVLETRRGAHLALSLERLEHVANQPILAERGDSGSLVVNLFDQVVGILTQKGIEYSSIVTTGAPPPGAVSGFATQMMTEGSVTGAADSVGISF